jgi:hypothetical protein
MMCTHAVAALSAACCWPGHELQLHHPPHIQLGYSLLCAEACLHHPSLLSCHCPLSRQALLSEVRSRGAAVPEVSWAVPGEDAAAAALMGAPDSFLSPGRLALYATKRNDPGVPQVGF